MNRIKRIIKKWLGVKDTHYMTCEDGANFNGEYISVNGNVLVAGMVIDINGIKYHVIANCIKVIPFDSSKGE